MDADKQLTCRVLHQSRMYIAEPWRWVQGKEHRRGNGGPDAYCAIGIVKRVCREYGVDSSTVLDRLTVALPAGYDSVPNFNDALLTKQTDIVALFERAERGCT